MKKKKPAAVKVVLSKTDLTKREIEILMAASECATTSVIAEKFFISPKTVETHKANVYRKLKVKDITAAVATALRNKWIE